MCEVVRVILVLTSVLSETNGSERVVKNELISFDFARRSFGSVNVHAIMMPRAISANDHRPIQAIS